jgi:hypothetical protein
MFIGAVDHLVLLHSAHIIFTNQERLTLKTMSNSTFFYGQESAGIRATDLYSSRFQF